MGAIANLGQNRRVTDCDKDVASLLGEERRIMRVFKTGEIGSDICLILTTVCGIIQNSCAVNLSGDGGAGEAYPSPDMFNSLVGGELPI